MELKKASEELGISTRHLHRLIRSKTLPAKKTTIIVELKKNVWDIDDKTIEIAKDVLGDWRQSERDFGSWLSDWVTELNLSESKLAQMSRIKKRALLKIMNGQKVRMPAEEYQERIIAALIRVLIDRSVSR